MASHATVDEIIHLARQLSPPERLKLIEKLAPDLETRIGTPLRSLRGMLKGSTLGNEDIQQVRREMWHVFPREAS